MKLKLKNTPEQIELIKAMGSKNSAAARDASEAFAAFLGPVIQQVLMTAGTASGIYTDAEFDEDDNPSYPLDLYYNENEGYITVWSQHLAGGLPTSQVEGVAEMKIATYRLDSAVSWLKRYARRSRLDVVSKAIERMANEVLIKQERNAWAVILRALAEASTATRHGGTLQHTVASKDAGLLTLDDMNKLMIRLKRINESYSGHTPVSVYSSGLTDLYVSPEVKGQVRSFSWNPLNTTGKTQGEGYDQTLPDDVRSDIYRSGGMQSIFGVNIVEMIELGNGQKYNTLFDSFANAGSPTNATPGHATADDGSTATASGVDGHWSTDANITDEIVIGLDNSRGAFIRPVAREHESGGTFSALPDEQFNAYGSRVEKVGFYGFLEEGRICLDSRAIAGIVV
jgi:hypothetical protein